MHKTTPPPPLKIADAERDADAKLEWLLRCAVAVGAKEPGAVARAKAARAGYAAALAELRRAERAAGREGSINYVRAKMGQSRHSANARGPGDDHINWRDDLETALAELGRAVW